MSEDLQDALRQERLFISQESAFCEIKTLRVDRTAAVRNYAAEATRRRRKILLCRILF